MSKRVLTIHELEARNAQEAYFGKGIQLAGVFDLGAKAPLDSRATVKTLAERDAHVTGNRAYEGMLVYVEADETTYQLRKGKWEVFGFNENDFQAQVVDDLVTDDGTKALSARQGKVLNEKITAVEGKVDQEVSDREAAIAGLDTKIGANTAAIAQEVTDREAAITATEGKITAGVTEAKGYTDAEIVKVSGTVTALEGRVEANETEIAGIPAKIATAKSEAIEGAKTYTDAEIVKVNTAFAEGDANTLAAAKTYADGKDVENLAAAKAHAEAKVAELKTEITTPDAGAELDVKFKNIIVAGDLEVKGTVTSIDTTELNVENAIIEVNSKGADLTESDVHLGLRANLGGEAYSDLVYCSDLGKWIIQDTHPENVAKSATHGPVVKTLAFEEDVNGKITAVEGRLDAVEPKVEALETSMEAVEGRLDAIEAVEAVSEQITVPSDTINLSKVPTGKVEVIVNGLLYVEGFTVEGQVITWLAEDFSLEADDIVVVKYSAVK